MTVAVFPKRGTWFWVSRRISGCVRCGNGLHSFGRNSLSILAPTGEPPCPWWYRVLLPTCGVWVRRRDRMLPLRGRYLDWGQAYRAVMPAVSRMTSNIFWFHVCAVLL